MSQTWSDNSFEGGHVAQTDLQNMENNFACLKSCFAGATAPSNAVDGMWWHDTTANMIKHYYDGAWRIVFDLANLYAITARDCSRSVVAGTAITGGGALTGNVTLNHDAHTGDVTGAAALTISADAVDASHMSHGLSQIFTQYLNSSVTDLAWADQTVFLLKCPSGPTVLRIYARLASHADYAAEDIYARLAVATVGASAGGVSVGTTYAVVDCGTVDMSGETPGDVFVCSVQAYSDSAAYPGRFSTCSVWWE